MDVFTKKSYISNVIFKINDIDDFLRSDFMTRPQKIVKISYFVLTLLSNLKKSGRFVHIEWPLTISEL